jgi:SLT domain-containing protein
MAESIVVGEVAVAVTPDAEGFDDKMREQLVPSASTIGEEWGQRFMAAINEQIGDMMAKWSDESTEEASTGASEAGETYGKAFKDSAEEQLDKGIKTEVVVSTEEATTDMDKMRAEAEKPIVVKVITEQDSSGAASSDTGDIGAAAVGAESTGAAAASSGASDVGEDALGALGGTALVEDTAKDGEEAAEGFGSRFSSKVKELFGAGSAAVGNMTTGLSEHMSEAGEDAGKDFGGKFGGTLTSSLGSLPLVGGALAIVAGGLGVAAIQGEKLENAIIPLKGVMDNLGISYTKNSGEINTWGSSMASVGVTTSTAMTGLTKLLPLTRNLGLAQKLSGDAADYAAAKGTSYATALAFVAKAAQNPTRAFKQLGDTVASGGTQSAAMIKAQSDLADQITMSGGIAKFAAQHNMTLAQAQKYVSEATNGTSDAVIKLAGKNVSLSSIVADVTGANEGNATSIATLHGLHLSLAQATELTTKATNGSSVALSHLGIDVLPTDATAAEKAAIAHQALNAEFSGIAAAKAHTFGGEIKTIGARFEDLFEKIGMMVLPVLTKLMGFLTSHVGLLEIIAVGAAAVAAAFLLLAAATFVVANAMTLGIGLAVAAIIVLFVKFHKQIVGGLIDAWNAVKNGVVDAWDFIVNLFKKYWQDIVAVIAGPIGVIILLVVKFHKQIIGEIERLWDDVKNATVSAWNDVVGFVKKVLDDIVEFFVSMASDLISDATKFGNDIEGTFDDLMDFIKNIWNAGWNFIINIGKTAWNTLHNDFEVAVNDLKNIWATFWTGVKALASDAWSWLETNFDKFWGWLKSGWQTAVTGFKNIWDAIKADAEAPVKFVVDTVYNQGIVPVVDAISGIIGKKALPKVSFATGGVVPGYSATDNVHGVSVRGGEGILVPEAVAKLGGPAAIHALNRSAGYEPTMGFDTKGTGFGWGGIVGGFTGAVEHVGHDVISTAEGAITGIAHELRHLAGDALGAAINKVVNPLISKIPGTNTGFGELIKNDITHIEQDFVSWVEGTTKQSASSGGYAGVGSADIRSDITSILKTLGLSPSLLANWMTQVQTESGGNARAVNNWDSNAAKGTPSVGLVQVIGPTFAEYAGPYKNVGPFIDGTSVNPMANLYAGINYAKNAYGADMAGVIGQGHGYADGTMGAQRGWAWVGERGPELAFFHGGETVYSHEQSMAALKAMPGVGGYYAGTNPNLTSEDLNQGTVASMKAALGQVESQLNTLIKATKGVGGDTASALNSTSRQSGNRAAFNTRGY